MTDRRSAGAESLAVFDKTLDRLLAGSGYDPSVQDGVLTAIRGGASTMREVAQATGLTLSTVERAISGLVARGLVETRDPSSAGDEPVASAG